MKPGDTLSADTSRVPVLYPRRTNDPSFYGTSNEESVPWIAPFSTEKTDTEEFPAPNEEYENALYEEVLVMSDRVFSVNFQKVLVERK